MNERAADARILVVGSMNVDLVAYAERLPEAGETVIGSRFGQGFGGKGANQAVAAARFGAEVALVGAVGDDGNGRETLANLVAQGVATDDIAVIPGQTSGVAPIWVDGAGRNRIIVVPGANDHLSAAAAAEAVTRWRPAVVVAQFETPQASSTAAFEAARAVGAITILNPAPGAPIDAELLAVTHWLTPNETEFALIGGAPLSGEPAADWRTIDTLAREVDVDLIVTLGPRGVALRRQGEAIEWIEAPVVQVVDTSGAGDAFIGAFAVGLALGWAPARAARLGTTTASDSVTRPGTQASYPDRAAAAALLATLAPR